MSYSSWHNYGYGICVDDIKEQSVDRLQALLKLAPELNQEICAWLSERSIVEPTWEDYMEFDQDNYLGLATILQKVIEETEGLCLTACDDYNSVAYLIYQPHFPWELSDQECELTEEQLNAVFHRYVSLLTAQEIEISQQAVENGG